MSITQVQFKRSHRCFAEGEAYQFRPLTLLCGDQGSGKSTLLFNLLRFFQKTLDIPKWGINPIHDEIALARETLAVTASDNPSVYSVDFEKFKTATVFKSDDIGEMMKRAAPFWSAGADWKEPTKSHGERALRFFEETLRENPPGVLLLDEPEQGLSLRSCHRLNAAFRRLLDEGHQIIASTHHPVLIESAQAVLSLEHKRWMKAGDFLASQTTAL